MSNQSSVRSCVPLTLLLLTLSPAPEGAAKSVTHMTGILSVADDGSVDVDLVYAEKPVKYTGRLTDAERAWFRTIVRAVPENVGRESRTQKKPCGGGYPNVSVRVTVDGKQRTFGGGGDDPSLEPLWEGIGRVITQARILTDLDNKTYDALTALSPHLVGPKVLQPATVVEGLTTFIRTCQDDGKLGYALEAIAHGTTPEQFAGTLALELERGDTARRELLINVTARHPFIENIPKSHLRALETLHAAFGKSMKRRAA